MCIDTIPGKEENRYIGTLQFRVGISDHVPYVCDRIPTVQTIRNEMY